VAAEHRDRQGPEGERGSASVELIGVLPFLIVAVLVAAQIALAGASLWSAAIASRAGARADLVGGDAPRAARRALPEALRGEAEVRAGDGVAVSVPLPAVGPGMPDVRIGAESSLRGDGG
jgi:hypothetical protein